MQALIIVFFITITTYVVHTCQLKCSPTQLTCNPGQPLKLNHCQSCLCAQNGQELGACTKIACTYPPGRDPRNCTIGRTWTRNCNSCCCIENLGTVCTNNRC